MDHESISQTEILIKLQQVVEMTSLSRAQIYRYRHDLNSNFPHPVSLGGIRIAWRKSEIEKYVQLRQSFLSVWTSHTMVDTVIV